MPNFEHIPNHIPQSESPLDILREYTVTIRHPLASIEGYLDLMDLIEMENIEDLHTFVEKIRGNLNFIKQFNEMVKDYLVRLDVDTQEKP